jgi:hypothetical protein
MSKKRASPRDEEEEALPDRIKIRDRFLIDRIVEEQMKSGEAYPAQTATRLLLERLMQLKRR